MKNLTTYLWVGFAVLVLARMALPSLSPPLAPYVESGSALRLMAVLFCAALGLTLLRRLGHGKGK